MKWFTNIFRYKVAKRDLHNKTFIKDQIKEHQDKHMFRRYDVFVNRWNHLCMIISLTPDEREISNGNLSLEDAIFYDKLNVMNSYITNRMLLGDLMIPYIKKIENSYSYKVVYKPVYEVYSVWWIIKNILFYSILLTGMIFAL